MNMNCVVSRLVSSTVCPNRLGLLRVNFPRVPLQHAYSSSIYEGTSMRHYGDHQPIYQPHQRTATPDQTTAQTTKSQKDRNSSDKKIIILTRKKPSASPESFIKFDDEDRKKWINSIIIKVVMFGVVCAYLYCIYSIAMYNLKNLEEQQLKQKRRVEKRAAEAAKEGIRNSASGASPSSTV